MEIEGGMVGRELAEEELPAEAPIKNHHKGDDRGRGFLKRIESVIEQGEKF